MSRLTTAQRHRVDVIINVYHGPDGKQQIFWYVPDGSAEGTEVKTSDGLPAHFVLDKNELLVSDEVKS